MPDLMPAPGSMAISAPSAFIFFTVSGVAATRGSAGSISTGMAIFMGVRCGSRQEGADGGYCLPGKIRFVTRKVGAFYQLFKPRLVRVAGRHRLFRRISGCHHPKKDMIVDASR